MLSFTREMKLNEYLFLTGILICFLIANTISCTSDQLEEIIIDNEACDTLDATYDGMVSVIINSTCSLPGCHNAGSVFGDYTTYSSDLIGATNSGEFEDRIIVNRADPVRGMPRGDELDDDELEIMRCWIENGFPE